MGVRHAGKTAACYDWSMPINRQMARLSVRLPKTELSRIKKLAVSRGVTLQEAVHQALEVWASRLKPAVALPLDTLEGSLARPDVEKLMRQERKAELAEDRRWS